MIQLLSPCDAEGFVGSKKATVNFKEVMYDGKPALLVVDTDAIVVQENSASISIDDNSITSINTNVETDSVQSDDNASLNNAGTNQDGAKPVYTTSQITSAFNSAYDHSTCSSFKTFMDEPSLTITDVMISELLPDYEKYDIESGVGETLKKLNEERGDKLAVCRKAFGKVADAYDVFIKEENLSEYEKKPNGKGCGEYKSISFSTKKKESDLKKVTGQFDTTDYDQFRNSIMKKENETMELVKEKFKSCLIKFIAKPMDKVKFVQGRDYIYIDDKESDVMAGRGRRYAQAWQTKAVLQDDTGKSVGTLIESNNKKKWNEFNGMCLSVNDKDVLFAKCNKDDTNQHFVIETAKVSNKLKTICQFNNKTGGVPHCIKKDGKKIVVEPLDENLREFGWRLRKTY
tara:strand:- start:179 stop:1384 length:1206 start_codon:yes stop_codon:yes gene_type:complete